MENTDKKDLFDESSLEDTRPVRPPKKKKKKKKRRKVLVVILILVALVACALGGFAWYWFSQKQKLSEIVAAEQVRESEYVAIINSATLPDGWSAATLASLQAQALNAYDTSFAELIEKAQEGDTDALQSVLEQESSSSSALMDQYTVLFANLNTYPESMILMVIKDPSSISDLLSYDFSQSASDGSVLTVSLENVPSLKTFDAAWGSLAYGNGTLADSGSAPTALAMVFSYITENPEYTPAYLAQWAKEYGYDKTPIREDDTIFGAAAYAFGVNMTPLSPYKAYINQSLNSGSVVIVQLGTESDNHFVVVTGLNSDGDWIVLDPTIIPTTSTLNPDTIKDEILSAYAFW